MCYGFFVRNASTAGGNSQASRKNAQQSNAWAGPQTYVNSNSVITDGRFLYNSWLLVFALLKVYQIAEFNIINICINCKTRAS